VRASAFAILMVLLSAALPSVLRAQAGQIEIVSSTQVPFPAAPIVTVRTRNFPVTSGELNIRLRMSLSAGLGLIVYDSTKSGSEVSFTTERLLPEDRDIFAEATVFDLQGNALASVVTLLGHTGPRLQLLDPDSVSLNTQQPRFAWRSGAITTPPGPWVYELYITNVATQETRTRSGITDTIYVYPDTLQANTSYRWKVVAKPLNGFVSDSAVASSRRSFVIAPANQPLTTLLYQNFPNPFPAASSQNTCIWFDLRTPSETQLMIYDLRGHHVRTMVPGPQLGGVLPAGRYGRLNDIATPGCDPKLVWDGTADDGRTVPPGIYLVRLKTDSYESMKKIVFRGR
jgi:hypothetical protein